MPEVRDTKSSGIQILPGVRHSASFFAAPPHLNFNDVAPVLPPTGPDALAPHPEQDPIRFMRLGALSGVIRAVILLPCGAISFEKGPVTNSGGDIVLTHRRGQDPHPDLAGQGLAQIIIKDLESLRPAPFRDHDAFVFHTESTPFISTKR